MRILSYRLLLTLIPFPILLPVIESHAGCGFKDPDESVKIARTIARKKMARQSGPIVLCNGCVEIDTYVVVFRRTDSANGDESAPAGSEVTKTVVEQQMSVLNERFSGSPFKFKLINAQFIPNNDFYQNEFDASAIGSQYRKGDLSTLNIYFGGADGGSEAYFPPIKADNQDFSKVDGAYVAIDTVPGGSSQCCNLGLTLVHEVGHWLGLHHTFAGSGQFEEDTCNPSNPQDFVDDTPQQGQFTSYNCPQSADTCPDLPGNDPIHNYMDYSSDECYEEFTLGQIQRMYYVWSLYRAKIDTCPTGYLEFELVLNTDRNPGQTQWTLVSTDGFFEWSSRGSVSGLDDDGFDIRNAAHTYDICIPAQKRYTFTISDSAGDGLGGSGRYTLSLSGEEFKEGAQFESRDQTSFDAVTTETPAPVGVVIAPGDIKEDETWAQTDPFNGDSKAVTLYHDTDILWVFGRNPPRVSQLNPSTGALLETPMIISGECTSNCGIDLVSAFKAPNGRVAFFVMVVRDENNQKQAQLMRYDTTYREFSWSVAFDSTEVNDDDFGERLIPAFIGDPVISQDGSVVFINQQAGAYSAFDAFDGSNLWSREAPFSLSGFALADDGERLYAATLLETDGSRNRVQQPSLFEISTYTGDITSMWNYTCDSNDCEGGGAALSPIIVDNKLYVNDLIFGNARFDVETLEADYTSSTDSFFMAGPGAHVALSTDGKTLYTAEGFTSLENPAAPNFVPRFVSTDNNQNVFRGDENNPIQGTLLLEVRLSPDESKVFYVTDTEAIGLLTSDGSLYYRSETFKAASSVDFDNSGSFTSFFVADQDGVRAYSTSATTPTPTMPPTPSPTPVPTQAPTPFPTPPLGRSNAVATWVLSAGNDVFFVVILVFCLVWVI